MIYFTYNPNDTYYHAFLFKSDVSTQELDKFFVQSQGINIFPHSIGFNRKRGRTIDENFGVYQRVSVSVNQNRIESIENDFKGQIKFMQYDEWCKMAIATQKRYLENYNPSNEKDIREKSTNLLKELYDVKFLENEYTHTSLPVRADILAVSNNKEVITLEIKSDKEGGKTVGSKAFVKLVQQHLKGATLQAVKEIFKKLGITFTRKALEKAIPFGVGVVIGFSANKGITWYVGTKARDFFTADV
jgi:hypothetical protein